jgi:hypothetical protein
VQRFRLMGIYVVLVVVALGCGVSSGVEEVDWLGGPQPPLADPRVCP